MNSLCGPTIPFWKSHGWGDSPHSLYLYHNHSLYILGRPPTIVSVCIPLSLLKGPYRCSSIDTTLRYINIGIHCLRYQPLYCTTWPSPFRFRSLSLIPIERASRPEYIPLTRLTIVPTPPPPRNALRPLSAFPTL